MDEQERVEAQLNRPVREEGPKPPPSTGPPFGVFGCFGLAIVVAVALLLGFGGLFNAWITAGVIAVAAGVFLTIYLMRRNRLR
ncbi:MAG TPA: hypothetical protein VHL59_19530 [Thermoanaerobaculia bacterium]|nr:hypothetical protein [Thermoanaerobaculia bacterium]